MLLASRSRWSSDEIKIEKRRGGKGRFSAAFRKKMHTSLESV